MTPQERRDAAIELRDMALELMAPVYAEGRDRRAERFRQSQFLTRVAAELDRVPEGS